MTDDPIIADILARPLTPPIRHRPRSALRNWMETNALHIAQILQSGSWADVKWACNLHGMTNAKGDPVSTRDLRQTWDRIRKGTQ